MALNLIKNRSYRLLYFQPDPEDGDRVCVGVAVRDGDHHSVIYDSSFPKLSCLAANRDKGLLKFYLDEMQDSLRAANSEDERAVFARYGPQIVASEQRALLSPLTESVKGRLLERFVMTGRHVQSQHLASEEPATAKDRQVGESIAEVVRSYLPTAGARIMVNAKPKDVIGRTLPNVGALAATVRLPGKLVLIDGVDMKLARPRQVISRVNRVAHAFWEYGRARSSLLQGADTLETIGLVLNGIPKYSSAEQDAHEFALYQFEKEADLTISDHRRLGDDLRKALSV